MRILSHLLGLSLRFQEIYHWLIAAPSIRGSGDHQSQAAARAVDIWMGNRLVNIELLATSEQEAVFSKITLRVNLSMLLSCKHREIRRNKTVCPGKIFLKFLRALGKYDTV